MPVSIFSTRQSQIVFSSHSQIRQRLKHTGNSLSTGISFAGETIVIPTPPFRSAVQHLRFLRACLRCSSSGSQVAAGYLEVCKTNYLNVMIDIIIVYA
jgi:hypothetical protein